jgi:predicted nucleotidyltransferase
MAASPQDTLIGFLRIDSRLRRGARKMKTLKELNLKGNEKKALQELKERLLERFANVEIILYGSKARGDFDEESDIDLLILLDSPVTSNLEEEITHVTYDIELKYDVVFGKIVENKDFWNTPLANAMPLHWNIDREGVLV